MDFFIMYGLTIIALVLTVGAQMYITSSYRKYKEVKSLKGMTGFEVARHILDKNGLEKIYVVETEGTLTDHYDPANKVVRLSTDVFHGDSIASVSVAAHECGHAIQDKEDYEFMRIRSAIVPFANISSYGGYIAILLGVIFSMMSLIWLGILAEIVILLFQLVTLPVEIDASRRALSELETEKILKESELQDSKTMLTAAALTYVASVAASVLELVRLILIFGRNDER